MNGNDLNSSLHKFVRQNRRRCHNNAKRHRDGHDARYRKMYDGRLCDEQSEVLKRIFEQRKSDHRSRKRRYESAYTLRQTPYKHKYQRYCRKPGNRLCKIDEIAGHVRQKR